MDTQKYIWRIKNTGGGFNNPVLKDTLKDYAIEKNIINKDGSIDDSESSIISFLNNFKKEYPLSVFFIGTEDEYNKNLIDIKIIDKAQSHSLISSGAWAQELSVAMSFARKLGESSEESLRDAIINFMAEETKFLKDAQWSIDDLITTPFKAIFDTIPKLQRKIMKETLRILSLGEPSSPLSQLSDFFQKEYALD